LHLRGCRTVRHPFCGHCKSLADRAFWIFLPYSCTTHKRMQGARNGRCISLRPPCRDSSSNTPLCREGRMASLSCQQSRPIATFSNRSQRHDECCMHLVGDLASWKPSDGGRRRSQAKTGNRGSDKMLWPQRRRPTAQNTSRTRDQTEGDEVVWWQSRDLLAWYARRIVLPGVTPPMIQRQMFGLGCHDSPKSS